MGVVIGRCRVCSNSLSATSHDMLSPLWKPCCPTMCSVCPLRFPPLAVPHLHAWMQGEMPPPISGMIWGVWERCCLSKPCPRFHSDDGNLTTESLVLWIQRCLFPLFVFTVISSHAAGASVTSSILRQRFLNSFKRRRHWEFYPLEDCFDIFIGSH